MTRATLILLAAVTTLAACGNGNGNNALGNRQSYDGVYFRARVSDAKDNPAQFTVTVNNATRTLAGARDAARTGAHEHCIKQFGVSDLTWQTSPDVEDAQLPLSNGDLILSGTCDGWR